MGDTSVMDEQRTVVHLMRHGEVDNPQGVLYGRLPGYGLSDLGHEMARRVATHVEGTDIVHLVSSPLERARQTMAPIAEALGLEVQIDPEVIEAANHFEGLTFGKGAGAPYRPQHWRHLRNPFTPSWGEPYQQIADRMIAAVARARDAASGHQALIVSHQLPIVMLRRSVEGVRLWHDPRARECSLASLTSVTFIGDQPVSLEYSEPAGDLLAKARPGAGA